MHSMEEQNKWLYMNLTSEMFRRQATCIHFPISFNITFLSQYYDNLDLEMNKQEVSNIFQCNLLIFVICILGIATCKIQKPNIPMELRSFLKIVLVEPVSTDVLNRNGMLKKMITPKVSLNF